MCLPVSVTPRGENGGGCMPALPCPALLMACMVGAALPCPSHGVHLWCLRHLCRLSQHTATATPPYSAVI